MSTSSVQLPLFGDLICNPTITTHTHGPEENCRVCDEARALVMHDPDRLRRLPFSAAAEFWLSTRKQYLKERSFYNLESNVRQLKKFFCAITVKTIHIGHVREYQKERLINGGLRWEQPAGPSIINHEIVALQGILTRCGEWVKIKPHYEPLPMPAPKKPKVMTDVEEVTWFAVAATNPDWQLACWVAWITEMTSAAGSELRNMRLRDLYLDGRQKAFRVEAETAKNVFRGRTIMLNETALKYVLLCKERAAKCGSTKPEHYLFPFRVCRGHWEPTKPASTSWLRKPWEQLRAATGLHWITPHCFRHQHATISLESGEPEYSVAKRMGHEDPTMVRERYGHARQDAQSRAVAAIDPSIRFAPMKEQAAGNVRAIR